jgi:hypothetical protein
LASIANFAVDSGGEEIAPVLSKSVEHCRIPEKEFGRTGGLRSWPFRR